jgi:excisionase family DNA binding protein
MQSVCSTGLGDAEKGKGGASPSWRILDGKWDGRTTFTVDETAVILGVSRCHAWTAVKRGEIPFVKIGRRYIVPRHALERLLGA